MHQPTVLLLSTSDTDLMTARASGARYRWTNPSRLVDGELDTLLDGADVAVVRILGGYRSWQDGIDTVVGRGIPTPFWPTCTVPHEPSESGTAGTTF